MSLLSLRRRLRGRWNFGLRLRAFSRNDHVYLFSSPENARRLRQAYEDAVASRGRVMTLDQLRAELGRE